MHLSLLGECRTRVEQALAALTAGSGWDPRREMKLYAALGASLINTRGATGPQIGAAWIKALEIAENLDDVEYQLRSLWGLYFFHPVSGRHPAALKLAQRFYTVAANQSDLNDRLIGERMIGVAQHYLGDQASARCHIECALAHAVTSDHTSHIIRFQIDQQMIARVFLARTLWLQGFPDQAMRTAESSIENARAANHALSLCYALALAACPIALLVGDIPTAAHYARMLREHSTRHALGSL